MFRLAIFVDGAYLEKVAKKNDVWVDYEKLSCEILKRVNARTPSATIDLLRTYYYNGSPHQSNPPTERERKFFQKRRQFYDALERLSSFTVRLGVVKYRGKNNQGQPIYQQKQVDLLLGLDFALLSAKRSITHAAVLTGDSDMVPAFEEAKREGIAVWLFTGEPQSHARELWHAADERVELDKPFLNTVRKPK
jgi:uncharacterized LabA/DUF88 family protein